jgi:hypothetical protein
MLGLKVLYLGLGKDTLSTGPLSILGVLCTSRTYNMLFGLKFENIVITFNYSYTVVRDISVSKPLVLSLNTNILLTFSNSAAVAGVPFGRTSALVVPFMVSVTGRVAVVSAGTTLSMMIVRYPTGCILRKPKAMSTLSVPTVVFVETIYGIPPALVAKILLQHSILLPPISVS